MDLYGGIEAGGTKFVCAIGRGPEGLLAEARFPTTTPDESIGRALAFFREHADLGPLAAVGIASFGPIDPNPASPAYGHITTTPKPGWAHTDFAGAVGRALGVPVGFDTDVNVAALGEGRWGAAQGLGTFIYLTVGTGIGGGGMVGGRLLHGLMHPEMGHVRIRTTWRPTPIPAAAHTTAIAARAWPAGRRSRGAGARAARRSRPTTPPGTSRPSTWPSGW